MTQSELARAAGIGRVTEVRIKSGEQSPRYETLAAIAGALKRPVADILAGEFPQGNRYAEGMFRFFGQDVSGSEPVPNYDKAAAEGGIGRKRGHKAGVGRA